MTNNIQKYTTYKPSGVEWLGDIPEHWEVRTLKSFSKIVNGATPSSSILSYWDGHIIWVTPTDINNINVIESSERTITERGFQSCGTTLVPKGSIVLTTRAPIGKLVIAGVELCTNQGCKSIVLNRANISGSFVYFILLICNAKLNSLGTGTTFMELSNKELKNFQLPIPPLSEQTRIAEFLDTKTALIDKAIGIKEKQIELLKERRQIMIHRAVTRGIDPNVKLKPSGVEWIGDIPEHWEVKALKHIAKLQSGETISAEQFVEEGYPVFGGNGFRGYSSSFTNEGKYALIGRQGALCGNVNYAEGKFYASEHAIVVYPIRNENFLWLGETIKIADFNRLSQSAAQPGIAVSVIKNVLFPYPPIEEQEKLAKYILDLSSKIATAISLKEQEIEKLKEYKSVLINSAVTGKIKVG